MNGEMVTIELEGGNAIKGHVFLVSLYFLTDEFYDGKKSVSHSSSIVCGPLKNLERGKFLLRAYKSNLVSPGFFYNF